MRTDARDRIEREVEARTSIRSPYLSRPLGVVSTDIGAAIAYEWRPGVTLAGALAASGRVRVPFRVGTLFVVVAEVAKALAELAEAKLAHDNVSTCQVDLGFDGRVSLLGSGLSAFRTELEASGRGDRLRAVRFMAPERLMGKRADVRSDLFSAGVVLWEALTGRELFAGRTPEALAQQVIACVTVPPSRVVARVSDAFDALSLRLLARSAKDRPSDASGFARSVEGLLAQAGVREGPGAMVHSDLARIFGSDVLSSAIDFAYEARISTLPPPPIELAERPTCPVGRSVEPDQRATEPPTAQVIDFADFRRTSEPPPPLRCTALAPKEIACALLAASGERFRPYSARAHSA